MLALPCFVPLLFFLATVTARVGSELSFLVSSVTVTAHFLAEPVVAGRVGGSSCGLVSVHGRGIACGNHDRYVADAMHCLHSILTRC